MTATTSSTAATRGCRVAARQRLVITLLSRGPPTYISLSVRVTRLQKEMRVFQQTGPEEWGSYPGSSTPVSPILALVGFVGLCLLVGGADAALVTRALHTWYPSLTAPPGTPPNWVFRAGMDGALRDGRRRRLAGLAPRRRGASVAAMGLAACGECVVDAGVFRSAQPAAGAGRDLVLLVLIVVTMHSFRAAEPGRGVADVALSRLDRFRRVSQRRVLVVESGLSYSAAMQNRTLAQRRAAACPGRFGRWLRSVARAQVSGPMDPGSTLISGAPSRRRTMTKPAPAPPPALPGAASHADAVAPATRIPTDMSPNDALFDAINRGDIAAARDAMSRGAELDAHNVLGMTPMELSVDLGRNDISFLLLSYRGAGGSAIAPRPRRWRRASRLWRPRRSGEASARVSRGSGQGSRAGRAVTPRLFANDGGAPVPAAGFLGFGMASSAR